MPRLFSDQPGLGAATMNVTPLPSRNALETMSGLGVVSRHDMEQVPSSRLFSVLARRKWLVVMVMVTLLAPAMAAIFALPRYFDTQSTVMINTRGAAFRDLQATVENADPDAVTIGTQVGIIRSLAMALRVVDRLDLVHAAVFADKLDPAPSALARMQDRIAALFGLGRTAPVTRTAAEKRLLAGQVLSGMVTVTNDGHSYIITIQARSGDPQLSAMIANAFSDLYLDFNRDLKIAAIRRANSLLDEEMAPMRERLKTADNAMETYRQQHGLVTGRSNAPGAQVDTTSTLSEEQLVQIDSQLIAANGELTAKLANLREIRAAARSGNLESIPEVVDSPLIHTLLAQKTEISSRVASLSQTALSSNPELQAATASDRDVQNRINREVAKIASSVASAAAAAQARVNSLSAALSKLQGTVAVESRSNVTLRQLEGEAAAARSVYQDFLTRFEHTSSEGALQEPEADLISAAPVPLGPTGPPRALLSALALALAIAAGAGLALVLDRLRPGVRTPEQLESATGLFGLGMVPREKGSVNTHLASADPSIYTSALGLIASVLRYGGDQFRARVVLVTSAAPGEGKTVFATSLAANVGREGGRALLIDCDLHKPSVEKHLDLPPPAFPPFRVADDQTPVILRKEVMTGLDVITFQPDARQWTREVSLTLSCLIEYARERYDLVVLDTPPVLAFADAPILSLKTDGAIMVVRWRHTPIASVSTAYRMLRAHGVRVLGGVLTMVKLSELDSAEGGHAHLYRTYKPYFAQKPARMWARR